jgi:hypothetical protein
MLGADECGWRVEYTLACRSVVSCPQRNARSRRGFSDKGEDNAQGHRVQQHKHQQTYRGGCAAAQVGATGSSNGPQRGIALAAAGFNYVFRIVGLVLL